MKTFDVQKIAARWANNTGASVQKYKDSINAIQDDPLAKAAAAGPAYLAGVQAAENAGKRAAGLQAYGFANWKAITADTGAMRLGQGATANQARYARAMAPVLAFINGVVSNLPARGGLEANIARATAFMRGMSQYKKQPA